MLTYINDPPSVLKLLRLWELSFPSKFIKTILVFCDYAADTVL